MKLMVFLCALVSAVTSQYLPASPCPQIMRYEWSGSRWIGVVQAFNPPPFGSRMKLLMTMSIPTSLPTDYVGEIVLADGNGLVTRKVKRGLPIIYIVHFPLQFPIPNVVSIVFDNRLICSGPPASGNQITTINLEHVFMTEFSAIHPSNNFVIPPQYFNVNANNYRPTTYTTTEDPPIYFEVESSPQPFIRPQLDTRIEVEEPCGVGGSGFTSLILGGDEVSKGEWPWIVAMYKKSGNGNGHYSFNYFCAGTLISDTEVLTSAICMLDKTNTPFKPSDIIVKLGIQDLEDWTDPDVQSAQVLDIIINPNHKDSSQLANDIAVIKLKTRVIFNRFVRPVCMWKGSTSHKLVYNKNGIVVGWGLNEKKKLNTAAPQKISVPIASTEKCMLSRDDFYKWVTDKTLCGGAKDGRTGPCVGDSGSGLFVKQNNRWTIRGIVSYSLREGNSCDLYQYSVYTDVAKYIPWINEV